MQVISVAIRSESRAYPLRIMIWHEIVNDVVGQTPIAVTWSPLCNSSNAFDRRVDDRTLSFGTTCQLRNLNLVLYDRETESWWPQFGGECIVGTLLGAQLEYLPEHVQSLEQFLARVIPTRAFSYSRIRRPGDTAATLMSATTVPSGRSSTADHSRKALCRSRE